MSSDHAVHVASLLLAAQYQHILPHCGCGVEGAPNGIYIITPLGSCAAYHKAHMLQLF